MVVKEVFTIKGLQEIPRKALFTFLCPFCDSYTSVEVDNNIGWCSECGQMIVVISPCCRKIYKFVFEDLL